MRTKCHRGRKVLSTASLVCAMFLCACVPSVSSESTSPNDSDESVKATHRLPESMSGEAFLEKNRTLPGVITTDSGLQYEVLVQGSGSRPGPRDTVSTHYVGTLIDGTTFDSSRARGSPAQFRVDGVIRGWTEALQLMPVGSKWMLYVPSSLAYGSQRVRPHIGPDETLVFEVELLAIVGG